VANPLKRLRTVGKLEAISFLLLLGVAMPLKYVAGYPLAVKIAGWIHGVLFILFCVALYRAKQHRGWSIGEASVFFIAALLPFGPFVVDRKLAAQESESAP
jgi:integral membrane protein